MYPSRLNELVWKTCRYQLLFIYDQLLLHHQYHEHHQQLLWYDDHHHHHHHQNHCHLVTINFSSYHQLLSLVLATINNSMNSISNYDDMMIIIIMNTINVATTIMV